MDEALRTLLRAARAAPGDREAAGRLRAGLLRQLPFDPEGTAPLLDELEGVVATPLLVSEHGLVSGGAGWRRVGPSPARQAGFLPPRHPDLLGLRTAWEAEGVLRYLASDLALIEGPGNVLEARRPQDGALLWEVQPLELAFPPAPEAWEEEPDERSTWLGWAVAPWGAAALAARFEAEAEQRRVGRWTPDGRTTERRRVGRGRVRIELALQLLVAEGGRLGPRRPEELIERSRPGEPLLELVELVDWHDELLALSLDPLARQVAIRARDESEDWAVLLVLGDEGARATVGPAGSAPAPDDPFAPEAAAGPPGLASFAGQERLLAGRKLRAAGPPVDDGEASALIADERLWLQLGLERVLVLVEDA